MSDDMISDEVGDPEWLVIGLEGFWGTVLCCAVLYPAVYMIPGNDMGSLESPFNAMHMVASSGEIQVALFWYVGFIFAYNLLAIMVTKQLDSVWHSILDLFRPGTVWGFDLALYYAYGGQGAGRAYGEAWFGACSLYQLAGLVTLLLGTAVYSEMLQIPASLAAALGGGGEGGERQPLAPPPSSAGGKVPQSPGRSPFLQRQAMRRTPIVSGL